MTHAELSRYISIHALREEGDQRQHHLRRRRGISIHALREEGDPAVYNAMLTACKFLSTPSARRATHDLAGLREVGVFLSTPSARRATDLPVDCHGSRDISIHALREEGDATPAHTSTS